MRSPAAGATAGAPPVPPGATAAPSGTGAPGPSGGPAKPLSLAGGDIAGPHGRQPSRPQPGGGG
eukprot:CAMPEP_0180808800 /NCGR_PEP_ID=MMETSP1038_2-20121128/63988_1 /TAXON_ID=632150 /ORGANISM="Azadinium spinosum, Strain 3D9" /LENGTH=63 /DNA_ID=CAMNT_0022849935 /DNA_START=68 /DNA_END=255 /DNA_ORIENTATION=+